MAWKKESDTAAYHPIVLAPMAFVDWPAQLTEHDFANLIWGVISRAATQSASYKTDYVVSAGTLVSLAGSNWRHWVAIAVKAGYLSPIVTDDDTQTWLLVEDSEDLFHIRRRAEMEWEARRKKDNSTPSLIVPVRLRDGDGCRYCGNIVDWNARRGNRAGTYDHRVPGQGAESPEDLRVACGACNARRGDRDDADVVCPPRPAPTKPFYGSETADLLAKHGHRVPLSNPERPRTRRDSASKPSDPPAGRAPQSTTPRPGNLPGTAAVPATPQPSGHRSTPQPATPKPSEPRPARPGPSPDPAPQQPKPRPADPAGSGGTPVRFPGRVGTGSGRELLPPVPTTDRKKRSRGRRGRPSPKPQPRDPGQR